MYNLFKFIHVLTAIVWIGGSIVMKVLSGRISRSNDPIRIAAFGDDTERIGTRVFAPSSGLLLLSGIAATLTVGTSLFKQVWVALGIAGWVVIAGIGGGLLGPQSERLKRVVAELGPGHPDVARISQRIERLANLELVLFVLLVADMVFKPWAS
jgi:uncharacterized membrane protein